jgi:hypothetical protein
METNTELKITETEELKKAIAKELEEDDNDRRIEDFIDSGSGEQPS